MVVGLVGIGDIKVRIKDQDTVLCRFIDSHGFAQFIIGHALIRDVLHHADNAVRAIAVIGK